MNKHELLNNSNVSMKSINQSGSTECEHEKPQNREPQTQSVMCYMLTGAISPQMTTSVWVFYLGDANVA